MVPVYVQRKDRITAHFLTCFLALLVYRILEKNLGKKYTCEEILGTLKGMNFAKADENYPKEKQGQGVNYYIL